MLKILVFDTNYIKGISRFIPITKIQYWQKHDCKITILCTKEGADFYRRELNNVEYQVVDFQYRCKNVYSLIIDVFKINFKVLRQLKNITGEFDVVYSQSSVIDFIFIPWILKSIDRKIKWFVMVDNLVPDPSKRPGPYVKKLIPYIAFKIVNVFLKKADGIFVVTNFLLNYYKAEGYKNIIKTNDGYGIDINIFEGSINKNTPKVHGLYCGRIHYAKGIMDLVEVVKLITHSHQNFILGILGDGEQSVKDAFCDKITQNKLQKNFLHFGYISGKQKADIYRNSDFFLFLSYDEGCPHAVIEAFACNKQVIAYNLPIYHEVFAKYINSGQLELFALNDYEGISSYILKTDFTQKKYSNKLEDYGWDRICQKELESMKK